MNIEEVINKMNEMIEQVKTAAEKKKANVKQEDKEKIDAILNKTVKVVNEAGEKVKESVNSLAGESDIQSFLQRVETKCGEACQFTIDKINQFQDDPTLTRSLKSANEEIDNAFDSLMENEDVKKIVDAIKNAGNTVKSSFDDYMAKPETKENVRKAKKTILDTAEKAMDSLRKILDEGEKQAVEIIEEYNDKNENE